LNTVSRMIGRAASETRFSQKSHFLLSLVGNRRFRVCIENHLKAYSQAKSKHARSSLVTRIVDSIKDCVPEGRRGGFVRKNPDTARWHEVGETVSREKVGHALR
jgi:hypothetical protein